MVAANEAREYDSCDDYSKNAVYPPIDILPVYNSDGHFHSSRVEASPVMVRLAKDYDRSLLFPQVQQNWAAIR